MAAGPIFRIRRLLRPTLAIGAGRQLDFPIRARKFAPRAAPELLAGDQSPIEPFTSLAKAANLLGLGRATLEQACDENLSFTWDGKGSHRRRMVKLSDVARWK